MPVVFDEVECAMEPNPQCAPTEKPATPPEASPEQKLETWREQRERVALLEARLCAN